LVTAQKAVRTVGIIMIISLFSKLFGFVRELVIANRFGVSSVMDAFNIANNIPDIFLSGIGAAISTTFVPVYTQKAEVEGQETALRFSRKLLTLFFLAGTFCCAMGILFSTPLTRLLAPKFNSSQINLASSLTKILFTTGVFSLISGLCTGYLQAKECFVIPALTSYPINITIILTVMLFAKDCGIYALAIAWALAAMIQFFFILPGVLHQGFHFSPAFDFKDPELVRVVKLILPVFAGAILFQVNTIVDRMFASGLPAGTISALNYAGKVNALIISVIAVDIATIALPTLSKAAATNDMERLRHTMLQGVRGINFIVIPTTIGIVALRTPLIQFIYQRGAFDEQATVMTASALCYLSLGLFAYGLREIFSRVFYALNDTLTPMMNSGFTIALNILLLFILVPPFGIAGLAGATSISGIFSGIQLLIRLRHKMGSIYGLKIAVSFLKVLFASLLMGLMLVWIYPLICFMNPGMGFMPQLLRLLIAVIISAPVYLAGLFLLKAEEITVIAATIKQELRKL
jgi:putative peptidoglycan lipid II flippase